MEDRGLRVNMVKTKAMRCRVDAEQVQKSGKYPCGVCGKGVAQTLSNARHAMPGYTRDAVERRAT